MSRFARWFNSLAVIAAFITALTTREPHGAVDLRWDELLKPLAMFAGLFAIYPIMSGAFAAIFVRARTLYRPGMGFLPWSRSSPLQIPWLFGLVLMAFGLGHMLSRAGDGVPVESAIFFGIGLGLWGGILLTTRLFRRRFECVVRSSG